jgi:hypothetical protein
MKSNFLKQHGGNVTLIPTQLGIMGTDIKLQKLKEKTGVLYDPAAKLTEMKESIDKIHDYIKVAGSPDYITINQTAFSQLSDLEKILNGLSNDPNTKISPPREKLTTTIRMTDDLASIKLQPIIKLNMPRYDHLITPLLTEMKTLETTATTERNKYITGINDILNHGYQNVMDNMPPIISQATKKIHQEIIQYVKDQIIYFESEVKKDDIKLHVDLYIRAVDNGFYKLNPIEKHKILTSVGTTTNRLCTAVPPPTPITSPFTEIKIGSNKLNISNTDYLTSTFLTGGAAARFDSRLFETFIQNSNQYIQLKKEGQITVPSELINKYNVLYVQYLYYQLYIYNNITALLKKKDYYIYNFLTKDLVNKYYLILNNIHNKYIINSSIYVFAPLSSINQKYGYTFFFKHGIIIKILFYFFESIKNKWDEENWDTNYVIDLYQDRLDINIQKYFTIFNIYYDILDKYNEKFLRMP